MHRVPKMIGVVTLGVVLANHAGAEEPRGSAMDKLELSDGVEIAYVDEGQSRLGTLVFIHGGPGYNSAYLRGFAQRLRQDLRTILYDQRGSGLSDRDVPPESISLDRYVRDLDELLTARDVDVATIFGQSFGGAIALEYALAHPDRVCCLVLESPFVDSHMSMEDRVLALEEVLRERDVEGLAAALQKYRSGSKMDLADFSPLYSEDVEADLYWYGSNGDSLEFIEGGDRYWGYDGETHGEVGWIVESFISQGVLFDYSVLSRLEQLRMPVLLTTGRHDHVISPRQMEATAGHLHDATVRVFERSGHYAHIEQPDEFRDALLGFVENRCGK